MLFLFAAKQAQIVEYTEKSQEKQESRHVQLVREYGFHPRSKVQVQDGSLLPRKFEPFPADMYGRPLEEIDQFIYEEVSTSCHACFPYSFITCSFPIHFILLIVDSDIFIHLLLLLFLLPHRPTQHIFFIHVTSISSFIDIFLSHIFSSSSSNSFPFLFVRLICRRLRSKQ